MGSTTDELVLDGKTFISVKRAASICGYTTDYVGQLCRKDKIEATRVGRNWYVLKNSILDYKSGVEAEISSPEKVEPTLREIAEKAKQESAEKQKIGFDDSFVMYFRDESPLFPEIDKYSHRNKVDTPVVPKKSTPMPQILTNRTEIEYEPSFFEKMDALKRVVGIGVAFGLVFMAAFSINGSYTASLLGSGVAAAGNSKFAETTYEEIIQPFELVAKEINSTIDTAIYTYLYE